MTRSPHREVAMAKKTAKQSVKVVVEKAMPGWTVAGTPAKDAKRAASRAEPDAVSPSLSKMQAKASGKKSAKPVKFTALKKHHARFVRVKPASAPDADSSQEKVVLVRDGKVVARQG
jgi:hypothetical protein